ncbi:hypothetical protein BS47DRAFT_1360707 [Hydnum rufescens UP504]|uniref:Uncharacterized protein n=1 Tax=Hydnum rufescens UP504 TaxID=1448309 RepID=A0A9P6DYQ7_9AGAM|nr:hypothetical protein BS47DRAFT_1360707 [Hydnum rufescens UP504]
MAFVFLWVVGAFALDQPTESTPTVCIFPPMEFEPLFYHSREGIFWTGAAIAVLVSLVRSTLRTLIEGEGLWTVWFRLATFEHYLWIGVVGILIPSFRFLILEVPPVLAFALFLSSSGMLGPRGVIVTSTKIDGRHGPVPCTQGSVPPCRQEPPLVLGIRSQLIGPDPTELLKVSSHPASLDISEEGSSLGERRIWRELWATIALEEKDIPRGAVTPVAPAPLLPSYHSTLLAALRPLPAEGLFPPVKPGESASLLWGEHLGFSRRVSRGILGIPPRLLTSQPVTDAGHNGQALCLMHGVCAPRSHQVRREQRPMAASFQGLAELLSKGGGGFLLGGLGDVFVKAATELALLFADSSAPIIKDWFEQVMEQQDLALARRAYQLGATDEELSVLYRLSYATMLVSLACHTQGRRKRPEMTVFRAYCALNQRALPDWASSEEMLMRVNEESVHVPPNANLEALVHAVLPKTSPPPPAINPGVPTFILTQHLLQHLFGRVFFVSASLVSDS